MSAPLARIADELTAIGQLAELLEQRIEDQRLNLEQFRRLVYVLDRLVGEDFVDRVVAEVERRRDSRN